MVMEISYNKLSDLENACGLSRRAWRKALQALVDEGGVEAKSTLNLVGHIVRVDFSLKVTKVEIWPK